MRLTETVETSTGPVTVRELTVGEVRQWLASLNAAPAVSETDLVGSLLFADCSLADMRIFCVGDVDFDALTQTEINSVIDAAKRINPDFFRLRLTLIQAGEKAIAAQIGN